MYPNISSLIDESNSETLHFKLIHNSGFSSQSCGKYITVVHNNSVHKPYVLNFISNTIRMYMYMYMYILVYTCMYMLYIMLLHN